nr:hypothetical protein [Pseudonocardia sp. AL041005-10]
MTAPVRDPHRHVLTVPVSDEQLAEDVAAFLAEGLTAGSGSRTSTTTPPGWSCPAWPTTAST